MSPLLVLLVFQDPGTPTKPVHPTHMAVAVSNAPVTAREAREAFMRVSAHYTKVSGRDVGTPVIPDLDRAATRAEIVGEMARLYAAAEPALRFTPVPTRHDATKYRIDAAHRASLDKLVTIGCVGRVAPLAVGPDPSLTPKEFGDALGFFIARLAQMSHLPSPKWTPMLKND